MAICIELALRRADGTNEPARSILPACISSSLVVPEELPYAQADKTPQTTSTLFMARKAASLFSLGMFVIYGVIFFQLRQPLTQGYSDFISFYTAGKVLQGGAAESLYDITLQYKIQREVAPSVQIRQGALPFVRPAFEAWLFWPLAYLSYTVAFLVWNLFSCACVVVALLVLRQEIPELLKISPSLMLASGLSYFPVFLTILHGQDSLVLLLIYVLGFRALRREKPFVCGLTLGLGIFKFPLLVPILIPFVLKKRLRLLAGFAISCLVLGIVSVATVGWSTARYYPRYLLTIDSLARGVNRPQDMPNLRGLLSVLLPTSHGTSLVVLLLLTVLTIGYAVRKWSFVTSDQGQLFALGFALNVVTTVLVSYHCHAFDLSILLLPMSVTVGFLLSDSPAETIARRLLTWTTCLLMLSPLYLLSTFWLKTPSLLALLVAGFAVALGMTISGLPAMPPKTRMKISAAQT